LLTYASIFAMFFTEVEKLEECT